MGSILLIRLKVFKEVVFASAWAGAGIVDRP
jgi:hypothetical protein